MATQDLGAITAYAAAVAGGYTGTKAQFEASLADVANKQAQHTTATGTLTVAGWSGNAQTISVSGVTAGNTVIVAPAPASQDNYVKAKIVCTAQGAGTLTFGCNSVPSAAITVNVVILGV